MTRLAALLLPLILAGACTGTLRTRTLIVAEADTPPAPREEVVMYRPGQIWVHGHWDRYGGRWHWRDGYFERERPGYVYIEGRWHKNDRGYVWVDGGWRRRGGVVIRDHR